MHSFTHDGTLHVAYVLEIPNGDSKHQGFRLNVTSLWNPICCQLGGGRENFVECNLHKTQFFVVCNKKDQSFSFSCYVRELTPRSETIHFLFWSLVFHLICRGIVTCHRLLSLHLGNVASFLELDHTSHPKFLTLYEPQVRPTQVMF